MKRAKQVAELGSVVICCLLAPGVAAAGPDQVLAELRSCGEIAADRERLACFDELAERATALAEAANARTYEGEGDWDSGEVTLEESWRITWDTEGSIMTIELRDQQDQLLDVVGNQIGSGTGSSDPIRPGTYRVAVRAVGAWRIELRTEE